MICKIVAYTKVARFDGHYDPRKGYGQGEVGGSGEGIFEEERIRSSRSKG